MYHEFAFLSPSVSPPISYLLLKTNYSQTLVASNDIFLFFNAHRFCGSGIRTGHDRDMVEAKAIWSTHTLGGWCWPGAVRLSCSPWGLSTEGNLGFLTAWWLASHVVASHVVSVPKRKSKEEAVSFYCLASKPWCHCCHTLRFRAVTSLYSVPLEGTLTSPFHGSRVKACGIQDILNLDYCNILTIFPIILYLPQSIFPAKDPVIVHFTRQHLKQKLFKTETIISSYRALQWLSIALRIKSKCLSLAHKNLHAPLLLYA